ncbi:YggS family pyridoxal phosphate-dependent enzyme [Falsihalocynthiibacter sp. SS001]|uniref:YggS family pyridoxal phosphate-dependent enzyme n=1 Tax=Falsihalocynthiibacter sp. SS001 TaxID=3349698 RepID=UPI0036D3E394
MSLNTTLTKIHESAALAGRQDDSVKLIAVSKVQPIERVRAVLDQGHRLFGENKVQEAAAKWPDLRKEYGPIEVHLLGPLQSNKTRQAMELFDAIHSLDRPKLANSIARIAQELGHCPKLFVQINTGNEPQKAGISPSEADAFIQECRALELPVIGLMCIPPAQEDPAPHFDLLSTIAERNGLAELSMGMSGDFEQAVAAGATYVRVGSAIFGARDYGATSSG